VSATGELPAGDGTSTPDGSGATSSGSRGKRPLPEPPQSVRLALAAIAVQLVGALAAAVATFMSTGALQAYIRKLNNDAKPKDKKELCGTPKVSGCLDIKSYVHNLQLATIIGTIVVSALLAFCAWKIRQGSRAGRSSYILLSIIGAFVAFTGSPLGLLAFTSGGPAARNVLSSIAAVGSVVAIVVLFRRDSSEFFNLQSPRVTRAGAGAGAPRPSLRSLFSTRPLPGPNAGPSPVSLDKPERTAPARGKAKRRTESEAVARGAELARARAKANKNRRADG
jgi:uncharacterized membrane protein YeaQ/YmgE (transglycosylase-associated protein family)